MIYDAYSGEPSSFRREFDICLLAYKRDEDRQDVACHVIVIRNAHFSIVLVEGDHAPDTDLPLSVVQRKYHAFHKSPAFSQLTCVRSVIRYSRPSFPKVLYWYYVRAELLDSGIWGTLVLNGCWSTRFFS